MGEGDPSVRGDSASSTRTRAKGFTSGTVGRDFGKDGGKKLGR